MEIPFFRYPHVFAQYREEVMVALLKTADRGAYILQDEVREFEEAVAAFTGARHVIGVANGTDGVMLALRAAGIPPQGLNADSAVSGRPAPPSSST